MHFWLLPFCVSCELCPYKCLLLLLDCLDAGGVGRVGENDAACHVVVDLNDARSYSGGATHELWVIRCCVELSRVRRHRVSWNSTDMFCAHPTSLSPPPQLGVWGYLRTWCLSISFFLALLAEVNI